MNFQIRLAGSNNSHEGRVEVSAYGQWGSVCDINFGLNDANVVCRQLGFHLGALQAPGASTFGAGSPILMDDVQCLGNETSLSDCMYSGWGIHRDCTPEQVKNDNFIPFGAITLASWT